MKKFVYILLLVLLLPSKGLAKNLSSTFDDLPEGQWLAWEVQKNDPDVYQCWGNGYQHHANFSSETMTIYVQKGAGSSAQDFKMVTAGCNIKDLTQVSVFSSVSDANSIRFINKLLADENAHNTEQMIYALALHKDDMAFTSLTAFYKRSDNRKERELIQLLAATLWQETGYKFLAQEWHKAETTKAKKHLIFVLSQSPVSKARETIYQQARNADSIEVKKDAIFWYAQTGNEETANELMAILKVEQERKIQDHLIFSIAQIEDGKGLPYLSELIKTSDNRYVQQQALFWLAHTDEESAMPILEELLADKN